MLLRGDEVLLGHRVAELRFFGDYFAFPGGKLDPEDGEGEDGLLRCACRELGEEVGLDLDPKDAGRLRLLTTLTTPPFAPVRYETQFFLLCLEEGEEVRLTSGEFDQLCFMKPKEALLAWTRGEMRIVPPVLLFLRLLAKNGAEGILAAARKEGESLFQGQLHPVFFSPGIFLAALKTETVPPATTTNTLVVGHRLLYLVDPGSRDPKEWLRLNARLESFCAEGARLAGILLTHSHPDHVGGVLHFAKKWALPVLAAEQSLAQLPLKTHGISSQVLCQGDRLELGVAPDGSPGWALQVHATPGHHPGHLVFFEERYKALIAGDLCSTLSTIVIDPHEGHLATYLKSLRRMLELEVETLYPAHGPAHPRGRELLQYFLDHREEREAKLLRVLAEGVGDLPSLLQKTYDDVPDFALPFAVRSLLSGLQKLEEEGRITKCTGSWKLGK
jgi:glyoxylase-like metal-dependent hydrolase (beta-lactamase superfamily II)/8-oxo-dGTP pyrophosphatase MutT (NUDIX family)